MRIRIPSYLIAGPGMGQEWVKNGSALFAGSMHEARIPHILTAVSVMKISREMHCIVGRAQASCSPTPMQSSVRFQELGYLHRPKQEFSHKVL